MPKKKINLNVQDHLEREDFPELSNVEFWLMYTGSVNTYLAVIDNNLNKKAKITVKKRQFLIKPKPAIVIDGWKK